MCISNESLHDSLNKFWDKENVEPSNSLSLLHEEERFCKRHFNDTIRRDDTGRYETDCNAVDGDSSVQSEIHEKLHKLAKNTAYPISGRRLLTQTTGGVSRIERLVKGIRIAIKESCKIEQDSAEKLCVSVKNGSHHFVGRHTNCCDLLKKRDSEKEDLISRFEETKLLYEIKKILDIIVRKAGRVAFNETTNQTEKSEKFTVKKKRWHFPLDAVTLQSWKENRYMNNIRRSKRLNRNTASANKTDQSMAVVQMEEFTMKARSSTPATSISPAPKNGSFVNCTSRFSGRTNEDVNSFIDAVKTYKDCALVSNECSSQKYKKKIKPPSTEDVSPQEDTKLVTGLQSNALNSLPRPEFDQINKRGNGEGSNKTTSFADQMKQWYPHETDPDKTSSDLDGTSSETSDNQDD
ncbi:hypothetical protein ILUMI_13762 [Ignelater luminosus]|uniref:Uncharacterized protein n=1 Tax=Ignelater luminosus TaxID=2038154 RepID=A0A8K0G8C9_IGNLU|nr:hypothetical protein ILUMI_13762 [Ignelater luminosus]